MAPRKIDPNTKIPPAVQALAAAADAAFYASQGIKPPGEEPPAPDAPPADALPPTEVTPVEVTPAGNADTVVAPAPAPDPQNWEHAYKSMKGRHDSAQNSIRAMSEQITSLQNVIASMQVAPSATPPDLNPVSLLTPEETAEYGAEFLDIVGKKALEKVSPEVAALKKELERVNARLEGDATSKATNARNAMNTALDQQLPMWRQVNIAPEFHSWLALPDPFSGAIRLELLKAAYEQNNTPRVLAFFNGFLANEAALDPAIPQPDTQAEQPGKIPLETFAAPGRAKTAAAPGAPVEKPTITRAQVTNFYTDVAAGKYRGKDAEKSRLEGMIFEAQAAGRIR